MYLCSRRILAETLAAYSQNEVGDIPGSKKLHRSQLSNGRRAMSREELSMSNGSTNFVPHKRTLSRSISVLAPWRPRHPRDGIEVNYNDVGKPPKSPVKTTTKTPSKPEKKKQKEAPLGRRGSDESKKSGSYFSQESLSSSRRNDHSYGIDTVDHNNTNSINRRLKKTNSETDLTKSSSMNLHSKPSGWFKSRK